MSAITDRANVTYREHETYGLAETEDHEPVKADIRADFAALDTVISTLGVAAGGAISVSYATRAALYADLDHAANTLAIVWGDSTSAYNGIYAKSGASGAGAWAITDIALPSTFAADLATVLANLETVAASVIAAADSAAAADSSEAGAAGSAATATTQAGNAAAALDAAQVALAGLGIDQFFNTKALANAGTIANGELILVWADESRGGARTYYVKESGVLVFKAQVGAPSRMNSTAGNIFYGSLAPLLNDNAAGAHNGDANTGFGLNVMPNATSAYACSAFGYGALNGVTTGHSNSAFGYQAGVSITTGIMNTLVGVDAAYLSQTLSYCTIVGHHCLNSGVFTGQGAVIIGQQTARSLTSGDYMIWIGRNAGANAPATGSDNCIVIGGSAAIAASVSKSTVMGVDCVAVAGAVTQSILGGYRNHYGGGTIANTVSLGSYGFFRSTGGGGTGNVGLGYQHGYSVAGNYNVFLGYNSGYRSTNTTVTAAVCIGNAAGFDLVTSGDLYIGNSNLITAHLIWGNFNTKTLKLRADNLELVDCPTAANDAGAAASVAVGEVYYNTTGNYFTKRVA